MNRGEYLHLLGEKTALERMIAETPEEDILDLGSLTARLKTVEGAIGQAVEGAIAGTRPEDSGPARVRLTFKIGPAIVDPNALNSKLHRPTCIKVTVTRVGTGRPRYVLAEAPA